MVRASTSLVAELDLPVAEQVVATRRDLHKFAEPGWCEFRTTSKVVQALESLGWDVRYGHDVVAESARMGVPPVDELNRFFRSAAELGAAPDILEKLRDGMTGVVGTIRGDARGPTTALRFDMDANVGFESDDEEHPPFQKQFSSVNRGVHHNCGHDGHTAIGLAVARSLADQRQHLKGEVRILFQPAEEGLRGAAAMIAAGVLDGVERFVGSHLGVQALKFGEIVAGYRNILASTKLDATFHGRSAHAAISPHVGRNALLAACVATQNLYALPRHGDGETRVNVGILTGGEARNAIAASAKLYAEVRGDTSAILSHMVECAIEVLNGAAQMHGVGVSIDRVGSSSGASSDLQLAEVVAAACKNLAEVDRVRVSCDFKGSDDVADMMAAVQRQGGQAVYFGLGSELRDVHHSPRFDFDERALPLGVNVFLQVLRAIGNLK